VAAADFAETFGRLLDGESGAKVMAEHATRPRSPSFFVAYAAVRREARPEASSIGSFPTFDLAGFLDRYVPFAETDPLGVTIPSVEDSGLAPDGHDVMAIHELIPPGAADACERDKRAHLARLLAKAERVVPGLARRLVYAEAASPASLARYTRNRGGAAYGWGQQPGLVRIRHGLSNLHVAGHWGEMGGGVLPAALSGLRAAARIARATA
jgi:phytoene dehydrogenase-like protein